MHISEHEKQELHSARVRGRSYGHFTRPTPEFLPYICGDSSVKVGIAHRKERRKRHIPPMKKGSKHTNTDGINAILLQNAAFINLEDEN